MTRNRIKRIVREGCRRLGDRFPPEVDVVIVARGSAAGASASDALADLTEMARRLGAERPR